jgi:hypothetical protein
MLKARKTEPKFGMIKARPYKLTGQLVTVLATSQQPVLQAQYTMERYNWFDPGCTAGISELYAFIICPLRGRRTYILRLVPLELIKQITGDKYEL